MRVTGIRYNPSQCLGDGLKPTERLLTDLCAAILKATAKAGFITEAKPLSSTALKIGLHMCSFRVNTAKLGYNARLGRYIKSPKGYKRTDVPTWDQRVEFNHIINDLFDRYGLSARIMSGAFEIRSKTEGARDEDDWKRAAPESYSCNSGRYGAQVNGFGEVLCEIYEEAEARDLLDSARLEQEHHEVTKADRLRKARERRERLKLFRQAKKVTVAGLPSYLSKVGRKPLANGAQLTHQQFEKVLLCLGSWEMRQVRSASIAETAQRESVGF